MPAKEKKQASTTSSVEKIAGIFHEAQVSFAKHRKCVEALLATRGAADDVEAWDSEYLACVACVLPVFKREPAAERIVEFVVKFATQHGGEADVDEVFVEKLCMWLLKHTQAKDKAVRFRATQLAGRIMNAMAEEAEVSDELFEAIETAMLARCKDKVPLVRAWALKGLFRLQDPSNGSDAITTELLRLMSEDTAKEVRMAAISTVAPSRHAIRAIMNRARDASEEVRLHALGVLRDKVEMRWLSISQRVDLLEGALLDRNPTVALAASDMLTGGWLRKACENDVLALLRALDAVSNAKAAQLALDVLLARDRTTRELVGTAAAKCWDKDGDDLQPEAAICLRAHLEWLAGAAGSKNEGKGDADAAAEAAPELPAMCKALHKAAEACEAGKFSSVLAGTCTVGQLAKAAAHCDFSNEAGRTALETLTGELLKNLETPDDALGAIFSALEASYVGQMEKFERHITEVISEVEDPLDGGDPSDDAEGSMQREQAKMFAEARLGELKGQIKEKIDEEDFDAAAKLKEEASTLVTELSELEKQAGDSPEVAFAREARCLRLSQLLLQAPTLRLAEHEVRQMGERFLPGLQSPHVELRELAVTCLGLHCHASSDVAKSFFNLFAKALQHDQPQVQLAALRAILDLLLLHSPDAMVPKDGEAAADGTTADGTPAAIVEAEAAAEDAAKAAAAASVPLIRKEDGAAAQIGALLLPLLELPSGALRTTAALGLCKLMHAGCLRSSSLLARLLLVYFDGAAEEETEAAARRDAAELSQSLALFFAASGKTAGVASALLPALRAVFDAAEGSRDANASVEAVAAFVLGLADDAEGSGNVQLATAIACESLAADGKDGGLLPRALGSLSLPTSAASAPGAFATLTALHDLLTELAESTSEKTAAKHVGRMLERVAELLAKASKAAAAPAEEGAAEGEEGAGAEECTAEGILAAHKALQEADAATASARRVAADGGEESEAALKRASSKGGKGDGRRKLAKSKSKEVGLTPGKAPLGENAVVRAA